MYNGWNSLSDILSLLTGVKMKQNIEYKILYTRRRTLGISVHPDKGVVVRVPFGTPERIIREMIEEKSEWIRKVQNYHASLTRIDHDNKFEDGESIMFMGQDNLLRIVPSDDYYIRKSDHIIEVGFAGKPDPKIIRAMLEGWYKVVAGSVFTKLFHEILLKYREFNFSPSGFTVRTMKKRWGSCSFKGKIAISADLIRLDRIFAEYVIIHELCHLRHHNHSKEYYQLLTEVYPDWKRVRLELKMYIR